MDIRERFSDLAKRASGWTGSLWAFAEAVAIIVLWALTAPIFGFPETWQLVINKGTTIITFLMVFIIQHRQNKGTRAVRL